ncbi:hypothetical protein BJY01DRAFT_239995 [Aspergillus pseudoustus]|uniref:HotDog domain-containing protein n=1 Tax=Aspergillus pseudoustus TaxID=1810923 RepID=A0ABR4IVQ0_9EURO
MAFCQITTYDLRKYLQGESVMPYIAFNLLLPENPAAGKVVRDGLESIAGAVAASLTRAAISSSNYTVLGTVYTSEVYIDRPNPRKSSMLAVIFHGLSDMETTESEMNGTSTLRLRIADQRRGLMLEQL